MQIGRFMGFLHPALVHFPIVLLLVAVALEAVAFFRRDERTEWAARVTLLLGSVSALFAFVCGNFAEIWAARAGISQDAMENHELLATLASWAFVLLTAWRMLMPARAPRWRRGVWLVAATGACVLLGLTGHRGAMLVYERGAAVQGVGLRALPTHEDLATLLQRQSPDSIFYSGMMHHIFGWMVLAIACVLLLDSISPRLGATARRFAPFLLLAGGLFLLVFSDQDAWPLYRVHPFRPIYDKEVLLHKTYAVLMLVIGGAGAWRLAFGGSKAAGATVRVQDRVMAVFALVGGALLFTHVHSAAPYANVAVGVYIHHTTMGMVALCIGAVKLLDDLSHRPARWRSLAYPAFMAVEAVLLVNYNEGLPWFLGYRHYSATAAHGGLVAPLGPYRAEMTYDPATNRLVVYTMRQDGPAPVALTGASAQAIVRVGDERTAVPLLPAGGSGSAWTGRATFLRGIPAFQVQALYARGRETMIADFEPWIDRTAAVHSRAAYVCPMHPTVGASAPGPCPLCGMALVPNRPPRPAGVLHDAAYRMDLRLEPAAPRPGVPARLTLSPRRASDGAMVRDLAVVHTKRLHLIVVSQDLSFFDHVHPTTQPDGSYAMDYPFPAPGPYVLYADLTPSGDANQVFRLPVTVTGAPAGPLPLVESPAPARVFGDYRVGLVVSPSPPAARDEVALAFTLSLNGVPMTDLEPMLGASGHCVILSQDTQDYLHSHPLDPPGRPNTGPTVVFHTRFPRRGLYKVWGQFNHHGHPLIADFVVRVP